MCELTKTLYTILRVRGSTPHHLAHGLRLILRDSELIIIKQSFINLSCLFISNTMLSFFRPEVKMTISSAYCIKLTPSNESTCKEMLLYYQLLNKKGVKEVYRNDYEIGCNSKI